MTLGAIIRQRRERTGLTQDQLALLTGISKPYLSNIETGKIKNPPSDGILKEFERHLDFDRGELLRIAHFAKTPVDVRSEHELMTAQLQKLRGVVGRLLSDKPRTDQGQVDLAGLTERLGREGDGRRVTSGKMAPVINDVKTGYPLRFADLDYPDTVATEYVRCPDLHDENAFAVRVVGDEMEPKYHQGDIVVFSPATEPRDGDDCFVRFAGPGRTVFRRYRAKGKDEIRLEPLNGSYDANTHPRGEVSDIWPAVVRIERLRED